MTTATTFGGDVSGSYGALALAPNSVSSAEVAPDSLTANDLATNSVGASEIAQNAVGSSEVADGSLTARDLAPGSVGMAEANLPIGTMANSTAAGLQVGVNFIFSTSVSLNPPTSGRCLVVSNGAVQSVDPTDSGSLRVNVGYRIGATGAPSSTEYVSSEITAVVSPSISASNTAVVNVQAGNDYCFGCALTLPSDSTDDFIYCSTSWFCN